MAECVLLRDSFVGNSGKCCSLCDFYTDQLPDIQITHISYSILSSRRELNR